MNLKTNKIQANTLLSIVFFLILSHVSCSQQPVQRGLKPSEYFTETQEKHNFLVPYLDADTSNWLVDRYTLEKKVKLPHQVEILGIVPKLGYVSVRERTYGKDFPDTLYQAVFDKEGNNLPFIELEQCIEPNGTINFFKGIRKNKEGELEVALFSANSGEKISKWYPQSDDDIRRVYETLIYTANGHYMILDVKKDSYLFFNPKGKKVNEYHKKDFQITFTRNQEFILKNGLQTIQLRFFKKGFTRNAVFMGIEDKPLEEVQKVYEAERMYLVDYKGDIILGEKHKIPAQSEIKGNPFESDKIVVKYKNAINKKGFGKSFDVAETKSALYNIKGELLQEYLIKSNEGGLSISIGSAMKNRYSIYEANWSSTSNQLYHNPIYDVNSKGDKIEDKRFFNGKSFGCNQILYNKKYGSEFNDYEVLNLEDLAPSGNKFRNDIDYTSVQGRFIEGYQKGYDNPRHEYLYDTLGQTIVNYNEEFGRLWLQKEEYLFGYFRSKDYNSYAFFTFDGYQISPFKFYGDIILLYYTKSPSSNCIDQDLFARNLKNELGTFRLFCPGGFFNLSSRERFYFELRDGKIIYFKSDDIYPQLNNQYERKKVFEPAG
ncbi:hypothetical protein MY04_2782 [Flammeovirga sp. MY04]|uniref:hypothetical protein n=1 Tax=Flammeovirga sp. MY04 TaxID=1191459 RepID=UPI000826BA92|nr:hypothetical protein [Flammeovirga sp. MY04]ANQ50150.2 hypothetical protein MY04_2782 [Flammeovirga sp. MY04]